MNRKPILWATAAAVAVMAALSVWAPQLPERVPMHFNLAGDLDRLGSGMGVLIGLPLTALVLGAVLWPGTALAARRRSASRSCGCDPTCSARLH